MRNRTPITTNESNLIVHDYSKGDQSLLKLSRKYQRAPQIIKKILLAHNIKLPSGRSYFLNQHYFDKIDTEDKAYFLGLMYADGSNLEKSAKICLHDQDRALLVKFQECIESNQPLSFQKATRGKGPGYWKLNMQGKHIANSLKILGCVPRKSLVLNFPSEDQVPEHLLKHFIRGYFDGDGSFSYCKARNTSNYKGVISIICTDSVSQGISNVVNKVLNIKGHIFTDKRGNVLTKTYGIGGNTQVKTFLSWLYEGSTIFMQRKYDKYFNAYLNPETCFKSKSPQSDENLPESILTDYASGAETLRSVSKKYKTSRDRVAKFLRSNGILISHAVSKRNPHQLFP